MSRRAQNRSQDAKIRSTRGTRSDCLIPESYGIQRYIVAFYTNIFPNVSTWTKYRYMNTMVESWYSRARCCWMCSLDIVNNDATPTVCNVGSALERLSAFWNASDCKSYPESPPFCAKEEPGHGHGHRVSLQERQIRQVRAGSSGLDFETSHYGMCKKITCYSRNETS
jgi:hypothetical protein